MVLCKDLDKKPESAIRRKTALHTILIKMHTTYKGSGVSLYQVLNSIVACLRFALPVWSLNLFYARYIRETGYKSNTAALESIFYISAGEIDLVIPCSVHMNTFKILIMP